MLFQKYEYLLVFYFNNFSIAGTINSDWFYRLEHLKKGKANSLFSNKNDKQCNRNRGQYGSGE